MGRIIKYIKLLTGRCASFLKQITLVMGQKNQPNRNLPAMESYIVNQAI